MALKIVTKVVAEPVVEVKPQTVLVQPPVTDVEALTAEYLELFKKFEYFEVKAMVARMDALRKSLLAVANETMDPKKPAVFTCATGEVEFSVQGTKAAVIDPLVLVHDLLAKFGPEVTASVVDIAMTPLRKLLSEYELKSYLSEEPGSRTLRAVRPV